MKTRHRGWPARRTLDESTRQAFRPTPAAPDERPRLSLFPLEQGRQRSSEALSQGLSRCELRRIVAAAIG